MVGKILSIIGKEISGVHNAAYLLGVFALLSQCLALVRDRLLAHHFGAGTSLDLYYASFRIPDLIFASVASLVSISVLIPFLSRLMGDQNTENIDQTKKFLNSLFSGYLIIMVVVSVAVFFAMPYLAHFIVPNFTESLKTEFVLLSQILLLQPIALGISNLLGSVTQVTRRFFLYALSPLFYNISIILGVVFLAPQYGLKGIIYGVVAGSVLHFAVQIPYILRLGLLPIFSFRIDLKSMIEVAKLSLPRTLTLSLTSIELIFLTLYAGGMKDGSISVFNFALNLQSVPFAIIGVSYSLAAFPTLSRLFNEGQKEKFLEQIETAARHIIFWSLPVAVLFIVLRAQIVRVILGSGNFSWEDTRLTAACLALFVVSLVAQSLRLLFTRAYYAAGNTKKPLIINLLASLLTITLPIGFIILWDRLPEFSYFIQNLFKIEDVEGGVVLMLPLGYSIGTIASMIALLVSFKFDFKKSVSILCRSFRHSFSASIITGFVAYLMLSALANYFDTTTLPGLFLQGFLAGVAGILAGVGTLSLLKSQELKEIFAVVPRKIFGEKNVVLDEVRKIE